MNVLITGGTGFLGSAIIARLAQDQRYSKIYVLVRPSKQKSAADRIKGLLEELFSPDELPAMQNKVIPVGGDLTKKHLGLSVRDHFHLQFSINQILHVGASTDFGAPIEEARAYNVEGTRRVLELADLCRSSGALRRFEYVSTAFVAGIKPGVVCEQNINRGQKFANNYEQSKWEAENLVRSYSTRIPMTIYRPSIVVGNSQTGYTPHFKVLYWPLKLLAKNVLPVIPCRRNAALDVVPSDFVVNGIVAMMQSHEAQGGTWHLTAGKGHELRIRELLNDAEAHAKIRRRPTVPMWIFDLIRHSPIRKFMPKQFWDACEMAAPYYYYLKGCDVQFDASRTHALLDKLGVKAPSWQDYKANVLAFCTESAWGRRLSLPKYKYYSHKPA